MNLHAPAIFSTAYLGPVEYYFRLLHAERVIVDLGEHYFKQTYRNRCRIGTSAGAMDLSIPVIKVHGNHTQVKDVRVSDHEKWQLLHWRAITAAYNNSPFFLYFEEAFRAILLGKYDSLSDFNRQLMEFILSSLRLDLPISYSSTFIETVPIGTSDLRNAFNPKKEAKIHCPMYQQVFSDKTGFLPNLSIIDLLFNLGPDAAGYLRTIN